MRIGGYDERAVQYVRWCLSAGLTLAKELSERKIRADKITCFLQRDLEVDRKHNFKTGGITSQAKANTELIQLVHDYLLSSDAAAAVVENRLMTLDSKLLPGLPFVHFGNEIYMLLEHRQASNTDLVLSTLKTGTRYPFIMVLTKDPSNKKSVGAALEIQDLDEWASEASQIIVGVYDEESYLICTIC